MKKIWNAICRWFVDPEVNDELARIDNELEAKGL